MTQGDNGEGDDGEGGDGEKGAPEPRRVVARRERRAAGQGSARLARAIMELSSANLGSLGLDDDLRAAVDRARAVTSHQARRRAERTLAGDLRRADVSNLESRLANVVATGMAEPRMFQLAEKWRARLIDEGAAAATEFPGGSSDALVALIDSARRERETGKPPGAARALFRHVVAALKAANSAPSDEV